MNRIRAFITILPLLTGAPSLHADMAHLRQSLGHSKAFARANRLPSFGLFQVKASPADESTARRPVLVPAGTSLRVRTDEFIDVDSTKAGAKFRGTLDDPIMLGGDVIVPRGANVVIVAAKVQQGGRFKGSDLIELKVDSVTVRGRQYPIVTSVAQSKTGGEGKKTSRKLIGGAGLGAIVGGIAGGGTGAAIGAVAGGATGTAMAAGGQPHLKIPAETRLEFQLAADWKIQ